MHNPIPRIYTAAATTAGVLLLAAAPSHAALVEPTVVAGNPTCADLGSGLHELKIDPPKAGTYTSADGALTVTVTTDGQSFDFSVADGEMVDLAFAKAGDQGGNLYSYAPDGVNADTGLVAPTTGNGNAENAALSHITFCYVPDKVAPPIDETGPAPEPEPEPEPQPQPEPPVTTSTPEQPAAPAAPATTPPAATPAAQVQVLGKVVTKKKAVKKKKAARKAKRKVKRHVVRAVRTPRFAG